MDSAEASADEEAEAILREALAADLYHGPAHNNLGVVYLRQGRLYEAANEFEWARKLMPGNPDPRFNLALTLERAGRTGEALAMYGTALEVEEGHLPSMQALARWAAARDRPAWQQRRVARLGAAGVGAEKQPVTAPGHPRGAAGATLGRR
jgi:Flp pilus assembly protein TadD